MHLLTREAFETYRKKQRPDGLLLVHISSRYLDLQPVVAAAARSGWTTKLRHYVPVPASQDAFNYSASIWVALSPSSQTIASLERASSPGDWQMLADRPRFAAWTDGHASILPIIKWTKE